MVVLLDRRYAELRTSQERDFAARHRTVEAVMAETAVVDFLYQ